MIRRSLTLREQVDQTVSREQLLLRLASAASVLTLFLAAVASTECSRIRSHSARASSACAWRWGPHRLQ
jgi:hypothetical protein